MFAETIDQNGKFSERIPTIAQDTPGFENPGVKFFIAFLDFSSYLSTERES